MVAVAGTLGLILLLSLEWDIVPSWGGDTTDFLAHAAGYGVLATVLIRVGPHPLRLRPGRVVLMVALVGAALELAQPAVGRDAQWSDMFADVTGAVVAVVVLRVVVPRRQRREGVSARG